MLAARNDTTIRDVGQSVAIGDKHFEVVEEFVYLGSLMTPTNDVSLKIQQRIQTAKRCFFGLRKHLQSSHLSSQTKFTIHKTLIRPVLLYGSETWVLTNCSYLREKFSHCSKKIPARTSKMVSTGGGTTTNSIKSLTARVPQMSRRQKQIALRWSSHDQKTRRPTTKRSIHSQTQWKDESRKTEIQEGGWGEQR
jgi:hypothetical protein